MGQNPKVIRGAAVLGLIAARGGSKGVPGKNLRVVGGKPLIAWTIEAAKGAKRLDRLILSSDDDIIIGVASSYGCEAPFKREARLATDEAASIDVVLDALEQCPGYEWVVLLQPTSPLRAAADIDGAIDRCLELGAPACVSVCEARENPYWMFSQRNGRLQPLLESRQFTRRQDLPKVYTLNGAVYVANVAWLKERRSFLAAETVAYEMPPDRSVDVDTELDLSFLEVLMR